jgi:hypothetical protein
MKFEFKKASKKQSKLRCALFGPSGSGKTYTALSMASGMGNKIALIDTERGSASKYADRFDFDVIELLDYTIDNYIAAINAANRAGYEILILDSISHGWQSIMEEVDKLAKSKYKGNTWSAWSEGTPMQKRLVEALLGYKGHIIATMRAKTEWTTEQTSNGKSRPIRIGLSPEQGKGIEYEFDLLMEISTEHIGEIIKDRTGKFQDKSFIKPGKEFGEQLIGWLNEGEKEPEIPKATSEQLQSLKQLFIEMNIGDDKILKGCQFVGCQTIEEMKATDIDRWISSLTQRKLAEKVSSQEA